MSVFGMVTLCPNRPYEQKIAQTDRNQVRTFSMLRLTLHLCSSRGVHKRRSSSHAEPLVSFSLIFGGVSHGPQVLSRFALCIRKERAGAEMLLPVQGIDEDPCTPETFPNHQCLDRVCRNLSIHSVQPFLVCVRPFLVSVSGPGLVLTTGGVPKP